MSRSSGLTSILSLLAEMYSGVLGGVGGIGTVTSTAGAGEAAGGGSIGGSSATGIGTGVLTESFSLGRGRWAGSLNGERTERPLGERWKYGITTRTGLGGEPRFEIPGDTPTGCNLFEETNANCNSLRNEPCCWGDVLTSGSIHPIAAGSVSSSS